MDYLCLNLPTHEYVEKTKSLTFDNNTTLTN